MAVYNPTDILEIILTSFWMFFGLSLFGYGIGNISSYLNNAIQDEVEYLNSVSFFEKLFQKNKVDQKMLKNILTEIES